MQLGVLLSPAPSPLAAVLLFSSRSTVPNESGMVPVLGAYRCNMSDWILITGET